MKIACRPSCFRSHAIQKLMTVWWSQFADWYPHATINNEARAALYSPFSLSISLQVSTFWITLVRFPFDARLISLHSSPSIYFEYYIRFFYRQKQVRTFHASSFTIDDSMLLLCAFQLQVILLARGRTSDCLDGDYSSLPFHSTSRMPHHLQCL